MKREKPIRVIAAINSGSSSLKFGLFCHNEPCTQIYKGKLSGIGTPTCSFVVKSEAGRDNSSSCPVDVHSSEEAANFLVKWLENQVEQFQLDGIGHRVVHGGMNYHEPAIIDDKLMNDLYRIISLAPLHLPASISIINVFRKAFLQISQVAHFDTAFHKTISPDAKYYPIPRHLWSEGIVRYGFHGISCEYVYGKLKEADAHSDSRKIIIAHLGSGSSITAISNGQSFETSMGFSPAGGMMMNTRAGDIDPGVLIYLLKEKDMKPGELDHLFNKESGIRAVAESELPIDKLLAENNTDSKAMQAIQMYCYHAKKQIGALAAAMGGMDTLVFTGGIGEHSPRVREWICSGLEFFGVEVDTELNQYSAPGINKESAPVRIHVIPTDEEIVIARHVKELLKHQPTSR